MTTMFAEGESVSNQYFLKYTPGRLLNKHSESNDPALTRSKHFLINRGQHLLRDWTIPNAMAIGNSQRNRICVRMHAMPLQPLNISSKHDIFLYMHGVTTRDGIYSRKYGNC